MKIRLFSISESATVDRERNTLSIFHVLDEIQAVTLPVLRESTTAVISLEKHDDDTTELVEGSVILKNNEATLIDGHPLRTHFRGKKRASHIFTIFGIRIPEYGELKFIYEAEHHALRAEYLVSIVGTSEDQEPNSQPYSANA